LSWKFSSSHTHIHKNPRIWQTQFSELISHWKAFLCQGFQFIEFFLTKWRVVPLTWKNGTQSIVPPDSPAWSWGSPLGAHTHPDALLPPSSHLQIS
jgi:hypothetical protein